MSDRHERLTKLRAIRDAHSCEPCESGVMCDWRKGVAALIRKVKEEQLPIEQITRPAPVEQTALKPKQAGYLGHKTGPGTKKAWRPRTLRNQKKFFRNKENWARFKTTAGIDGRITFRTAYERAGIHHITLSHYVNGLTDVKLSTALDLCEKLRCRLDKFAKAMREAWALAEQRYQAQEAINEAVRESEEKGLTGDDSRPTF